MEIKILYQGVHKDIETDNPEIKQIVDPICSSVVLIKGEKNIIVDTGNLGFEKEILENLQKQGLKPEDIDYVINTHTDNDHISNNYLFKKSKIVSHDGVIVWYDKKVDIYKSLDKIKIPGIDLIDTKGHTEFHISVIVKYNNKTYVIAGDAIRHDMFEKGFLNEDDKKSAKKILDIADVIIPGHGPVIEGNKLEDFKKLMEE